MSLFGNLNNTTNSNNGGGLFSSKPAATGGALFAGMTSSNANANPSSTGATGGGLFASTLGGGLGGLGLGSSTQPQQQSSTGGMFGGLGAATTTQPAGGSVFGGIGTSTQQTNAMNMFGGMNSGSITQPQQPQQSTGFGNTSTGPLQQSQSQSQSAGQNTAYFDAILERSRKRAHAEAISEDLPQLQLGLGDLRQRIKRLGPSKNERADGRAHYLLAASGVDPGAAVRDLSNFAPAAARLDRPQAQEVQDTDVESYLANLQTQTTLSMIADGLSRSVRDFDAFLEDNVTMEWDAQRKRIYQHFGIRPKESTLPGGGSFTATTNDTQGGFGRLRRTKAAALAGSRAPGLGGDNVAVSGGGSAGGFGGFGESGFGKSSMQKSIIGAAGPIGTTHQPVFADVEKQLEADGNKAAAPHDRFQRDKQNKYAEKVQLLNSARLQRVPFAVSKQFADVVKSAGDQHGPDLAKAYRALSSIVGEDPESKSFSENTTARERQYSKAHNDAGNTSFVSQALRKQILRGGARCLEKLAFERMEEMITRNPRDANLGGVPNVINKIKAYVRVLAVKKSLTGDNADLQMLGDDYVWALLYFLVRTGHVAEASSYVSDNAVVFRALDRNFSAYIDAYARSDDRRLSDELQVRINAEYNQRLRIAPENSIDPYRMACYKLIGRCDLRSRTLEGISQDVEDFAWNQLVLARETNKVDSMASEVYDLTQAQQTIREIGNRFFSPAAAGGAKIGSSFGAFVFLQIAIGMFEEAVSFLYKYSYVDGVHLAIALDFYGILRVSDPTSGNQDLLSRTTTNLPQISFARMVGLYTRDFRAANVSAAVDYLVLICLNKDLPGQAGANYTMTCHESLRELALESREFALLLGDMRSDGQRINGLIEDRVRLIGLEDAGEFMRTITLQAASVADDNGRTTDAVLLYHLATEYDSVITTINRALSEAVATPLGQEPTKLQPLKARSATDQQSIEGTESSLTSIDDPFLLSEKMSRIYTGQMYRAKIKVQNQDACVALQTMYQAKNMVENSRWTDALDLMKSLDILPLAAKGDPSIIRSCATKFPSLPQPVAQNVPNLLMWSIMCCKNQRLILQNSQFGGNEGTRQAMIAEFKQTNMDLTTYTSQLRYRFPAHIHEALARAQSE
ncbi:related to nucleoporin-interacting protein NIC96 [Rhynchosporium agropyri]|uniref:Related to nucleoporin-interacting protein NIC96 n=1 Tax=Rhynchosporium agropyri TaxID=914238 RepID=A0A1E1JS14_9HELO|nr:related to nucleoporin-interacting protein NIC96 [Rhynchosporium agropyri]